MEIKHIEYNNDCTGCGLCAYKCPKNCISLINDEEGFQIPFVDDKKCIECSLCKKVCPVLQKRDIDTNIKKTFAVQIKDTKLLMSSASGGAFIGIAIEFIKNGGYVVGVVDDVKNGATFQLVNSIDKLNEMVGSKYYQCDLTEDIYNEINEVLSKGNKVLFSGTPCQASAIKLSVNKENLDRLFLIDIICQGTPSKKVVSKYHKYIESKQKKKLIKHFYRSKDKIKQGQYTTKLIYNDNSTNILIGEKDLYSRSFQRKIYIRESCYNCKFTNCNRISDITIGDFWGVKDIDIDICKGVSLVLINSTKGLQLFDYAKNKFIVFEKTLEEAVPYNLPLKQSAKRSCLRGVSFKMLDKLGFSFTTRLLCYRYYIKN